MCICFVYTIIYLVAPFMGAWIEIKWENDTAEPNLVAPFMGAWIEILNLSPIDAIFSRRTLYGCVD